MKRIFLILLLFFLLSTGHVSAIEPVAVPVFTVQSMSDTPVGSAQISQDPRWILLYLTDGCRHCDDILRILEVFQGPSLSGRVVIVVGGGAPEDIIALIDAREKIASLGWYTDPDWSVYKTLPISGTPVVLGIREGVIEWSLAGTPWDVKTMRSVLLDWINY